MKVEIAYDIPDERIKDLLCAAFEGGSNYWIEKIRYHYPEGETKESLKVEYPYLDLPFVHGAIVFVKPEDDTFKTLDSCLIERGLKTMSREYPRHMADFLAENEDAITGDVFLQCCLFNEVVYG